MNEDFWPIWRYGYTHFASSRNQKKDNNKIKNKNKQNQQNRTVWKSDNQGVKEDTFIQTGRRGRDEQPSQEDSSKVAAGGPGWARRQLVDCARDGLAELVVPHLHADKLGGPTGE